jgi:hypothetical protein
MDNNVFKYHKIDNTPNVPKYYLVEDEKLNKELGLRGSYCPVCNSLMKRVKRTKPPKNPNRNYYTEWDDCPTRKCSGIRLYERFKVYNKPKVVEKEIDYIHYEYDHVDVYYKDGTTKTIETLPKENHLL